jgi:hypothetical protein
VTDGGVAIAHATRARVRLVAKALRGKREICERVARRFAVAADADRVTVRPLTGSVIVEREASVLDARELARRLEEVLGSEPDVTVAVGASRESTRIARAIAGATRKINDDVYETLGGKADLGSLVPIALVAVSAVQVSVSGKLVAVPWYSLVWYALRSFLTFNKDALSGVPEEPASPAQAKPTDA